MDPINPPNRIIPIPLHGRSDRRDDGRVDVAMPMEVDGRPTTTRNYSENGIAFDSDHALEPGSRIDVTIEYLLDGHHYPLHCQAEVMRVEPRGSGFIIGARLCPQPPTVVDGPPGTFAASA